MLAITRPQLITINRSLNDYTHLKEINKNLQMGLSVSDSLVVYWKRVASKSDSICVLETKKYANLYKVNRNLESEIKNVNKKCRKTAIGVGVGGTILGFILGLLLS